MKYLFGRFVFLIPTWIGITLIAFGLIRLVPGDPVLMLIGERGADPHTYAEMQKSLGLDRPLMEQYFVFVKNAVQGDLGNSVVSKLPVMEEFLARFPATIELACVAFGLATAFGIPLGILAAVFRNSWLDAMIMGGALVGYSMPIFWWGLLLILFFSVQLGWTPVSGRISMIYEIPTFTGFLLIDTWLSGEGWAAFKSAMSHILLPSVVLGTVPLAVIARMTRSSLLEVLGEDYIRTGRAKGLSTFRVVALHAFRNALIPVITVLGLTFGTLLTGAILTETLFSWPGIGKWLVRSVTSRDYPVIQGGILIIASMIVVLNLFIDWVYVWTNPRLRNY